MTDQRTTFGPTSPDTDRTLGEVDAFIRRWRERYIAHRNATFDAGLADIYVRASALEEDSGPSSREDDS